MCRSRRLLAASNSGKTVMHGALSWARRPCQSGSGSIFWLADHTLLPMSQRLSQHWSTWYTSLKVVNGTSETLSDPS
jgi:hypothetical protein